MKKVIIITSRELRHKFLCHFLSSKKNINLLYGIHENNILLSSNKKLRKYKIFRKHLKLRSISEKNYFGSYTKKYNKICVKKDMINKPSFINKIKRDDPDYIITFGCSILKSNYLDKLKDKTINIHLGLSPYYKGSGTNFFPFVNNELQFLGSTLMKISKKIDDGKIITQIRPKIYNSDKIHDIGNRIIFNTAKTLAKIILCKKIQISKKKFKYKSRYFKRKDFTLEALKKAYYNVESGIIRNYLKNAKKMQKKFPIIERY